jgi:DNA gyrase subunit B
MKKSKKESSLQSLKKPSSGYSAKDIYVLKGLEPVRKRPGMYIGSTGKAGLHHLIWECFDNSLDEVMAGYASEIRIDLLPDNLVRVTDNGRGIPVDKHQKTGKSALETVMTTLHAGAKFGGKAYQVAGGLHGVGVSVVCALSKSLKAEVCRDGKHYEQEYSQGKVMTKLKQEGSCQGTGTIVTFAPDPEIFKEIEFSWKTILHHLRQQAYLTKGAKIILTDERFPGKEKNYTFYFEGGLSSYVKYLVRKTETRHPDVFYAASIEEKVSVEIALQYTEDTEILQESFANNIHTPEGGMHLTGFRTALTRTINAYARENGFLKEGDDNLSGVAVSEGIVAVVSVKLREPQFEGQTKAKLGNTEAKTAVEKITSFYLKDFLERNPRQSKAIIEGCLIIAQAHKAARMARETIMGKKLHGASLPGKLADCSSRKPENSELYIVEGESAGGSAKQARDRKFQAILPLRGKILNVEKANLTRILSSTEIKALIIALGTAIAEDFDLSKLRYHHIIIMADADVDGAHICTLLLTLFYRHFKPIIDKGCLYIAQPPLYQIKKGKKIIYTYTEKQQKKTLSSMEKPFSIQRYKGLGEMNADQLWETTMDPETRLLKRVIIEDAVLADQTFDDLMGKDVGPRKKFIHTQAQLVKNLDI